ncbi:DedA family protein [Pseudonocardia endophytica]|uniref:Membrane-associated protein n=1 Tax=Pseudonocardia endophytica TaxID=401976 RepID=A0A4R1I2G3_PSEEN|nr:membrane-associated protein [Pseudonocardia endophytica]
MTPLATQTFSTLALGPEWLDPTVIIEWLGPWALVGVAAIIFAECGLLLGFFLPGDSLLFTAGLFVASGHIAPLWATCLVLVFAALLGNAVGYGIGYKAGPAIFDKPKSKLFNPKHVAKTHEFFEKYGNRAIVLGRFVPIVRTFITVSAGVARMDPKRYLTYSLIGGVAWAAGVTVLGYFLGQFTFVRDHIDLILVLVVFVSILPIIVEVLRARAKSRKEGPAVAAQGPSDLTQPISPVPPRGTGWDGPDAPAPGGRAPRTQDGVDSTAATTRMSPVTPQSAPRQPNGQARGPVETRSSGRPVMGRAQDRRGPEES